MDRDQAVPGARVTWARPLRGDNLADRGEVLHGATEEMLAVLPDAHPGVRHVLVRWSSLPEVPTWHDPSELRLLPDGDTDGD